MAVGGHRSDTDAIRRNRLDQLTTGAALEALGRNLRAGMSGAAGPFRLHGRRLRAEREAERTFEMSPALLGVAGFDGYLRRFNPAFEGSCSSCTAS